MLTSKVTVFAHGLVGLKTIDFLYNNYFDYLNAVIVVDEKSEVYNYLLQRQFDNIILNDVLYSENVISNLKKKKSDYFILVHSLYLLFFLSDRDITNILLFYPSYTSHPNRVCFSNNVPI